MLISIDLSNAELFSDTRSAMLGVTNEQVVLLCVIQGYSDPYDFVTVVKRIENESSQTPRV